MCVHIVDKYSVAHNKIIIYIILYYIPIILIRMNCHGKNLEQKLYYIYYQSIREVISIIELFNYT